MNVTIDLAKKHLQDMPENNDVLKADLIKVIEVAEQLEQQLKNCNLQNVNGSILAKAEMINALTNTLEVNKKVLGEYYSIRDISIEKLEALLTSV